MNPKDIAAQTRAPLHLLPAIGIVQGAMACRQGAIEYGPFNWRENPIELMSYLGAMGRHIARLQDGEWVDAKSGVPHLGHIIATASILLDANGCGTLISNVPRLGGHTTAMLDVIEANLKNAQKATPLDPTGGAE